MLVIDSLMEALDRNHVKVTVDGETEFIEFTDDNYEEALKTCMQMRSEGKAVALKYKR